MSTSGRSRCGRTRRSAGAARADATTAVASNRPGTPHRSCGAVKRGREEQVSTAGLVDEILQTGAVQAQVKSVGAGHVEAWAFGASGKDSNREPRGLRGGSL